MQLKFRLEILTILIFFGCGNLSPNEGQIKKTLSNLGCYQELVNQITSNDILIEKIIQIRESKKRGEFDPITVKQDFRLMEMNEIAGSLEHDWIVKCKEEIAEGNDFRGIRVIDKNLIIIEIDEFNRHTLAEKYSKDRTIEFHRLIVAEKPFDKSDFYFGTEHQIWRDTIEGNWIYEVTQLKK